MAQTVRGVISTVLSQTYILFHFFCFGYIKFKILIEYGFMIKGTTVELSFFAHKNKHVTYISEKKTSKEYISFLLKYMKHQNVFRCIFLLSFSQYQFCDLVIAVVINSGATLTAGTYTLEVTVSDPCLATTSATVTIIVENQVYKYT